MANSMLLVALELMGCNILTTAILLCTVESRTRVSNRFLKTTYRDADSQKLSKARVLSSEVKGRVPVT